MKKLKKQDFKKLACKGVAAGVLLASQASAHQLADVKGYANMLAANCSGMHGCHTQSSMPQGSSQGYMPQGSSQGYMPQGSSQGYMPQSGCNSASRNTPPSSGCSNTSSGNGYTAYNQPSMGCGAATGHPPTKYYYTDNQGKWREGQPPQEYTSQPANPYQDQKVETQSSQQWQNSQQNPSTQSGSSSRQSGYFADASSGQTYTADTFSSQLNSQSRAAFDKMTPEGKALSIKLANQSCKGQNDCKGLNSCKSDTNSCAGQGSCKGTSKGPFTDKNTAVSVAAKAMAEKRAKAADLTRY